MTRAFKTLAATAAALMLSFAGAAHAGTQELTFTGTNVTGDIFATTTGNQVTSITGWITDSDVGAGTFTITGLSGYAGADNMLSSASPYFSFAGLSVGTDAGGAFNFYYDGSIVGLLSDNLNSSGNPANGFTELTTVSVAAAVPEPASLGLLLAGIGMLGVMSSRRRAR